jgi:hypothetical protein
MGDRENDDLIQIDDAIVECIAKASEPDTAITVAEERPPIGLSRDPFDSFVDLCFEVGPQPSPAPLVPPASVPVFLGSQSMKIDVHAKAPGRSSLVSELGPGHRA